MEEGIEIPVKLSLGELKKQIREVKSELANATDPKDMAKLSERAGELQDNLMRVNEQAAVFSSGSKFEQSANALGLMNSQLMSLDFEGAAESALLLQDRINSITPEEVTKQMQGLTQVFSTMGKVGGQVIVGMVKNVGAMAKAFLSFGAQLMANPIFLIGAAIAAVVGLIVLLMNKLGILKPVLKAIGEFFGMIGDAIDWVIQQIKDFLDWIGLTNYAEEEAAQKAADAAEKKADAWKSFSDKRIAAIDQAIRMDQLDGKNTTDLELKKQFLIRQTARERINALQLKYKAMVMSGDYDEEEIKELKENLAEQRKIIQTSINDGAYIRKKDYKERANEEKTTNADIAKDAEEKRKQGAERAKQYASDRLNAERAYKDALLALMEEGKEKEIAIEQERFKRLIEDTKKNEKLTASEKEKMKSVYLEQEKQALAKIEDNYKEIEKEKEQKKVLQLAEIRALQNPKDLQAQLDFLDAQKTAELQAKKLTVEDKILIEKRYDSEKLKRSDEFKEKEILAELEKTERLAELALLKNENDLGAQLKLLEAQKKIELSNKELTEGEKAIIEERYRKAKEDAEKKHAEKIKEIGNGVLKSSEAGLNALSSLNDLVYTMKSSKLKKGSAEEEAAAKKNFETNKKLQISIATIQGIQGVIAALSATSVIPEPFGMILKAANAVAVGVATAANIAKIKATSFSGGGGGGAASTPSSGGSSGAATAAPTYNLTGTPNQGNNTQEGGAVQGNQTANITVEISESEITKTQTKVLQYENSATLNG